MQTLDLPELSAETELVLRLARPGDPDLFELEKILQKGVDWGGVMEFARRHNLLTMFYPRLSELPQGMAPAAVLAETRALFRLNLLRSTRLGLLLESLGQLLARNGIEILAMRGPLLAEMLYQPAPGMRTFSDLDILVHPQDFPRVYHLLLQAGWRPNFPLAQHEQRWMTRGDRDFTFHLGADILEVHWSVDEPGYCFPLKKAQFWEGKTRQNLLETELYCFSPPLLFLNLCLHGSRHRWEKLAWVFDLAWFAHSQVDFDWQGFWEWACGLGFRRVAAMGMQAAEALGGARFPEDVRVAFWAETAALQWTRRCLENALSCEAPEARSSYLRALDDLVYDLQARERLAARIYMVANRLFVPRQSDWRAFRLPERLYGLYYALRPLRLLWSALKRF
jgi:hypothetical protein